jgi:hypothetical protein
MVFHVNFFDYRLFEIALGAALLEQAERAAIIAG